MGGARCAVGGTHDFTSSVRDEAGDEVARATVTWKLGPIKTPTHHAPRT